MVAAAMVVETVAVAMEDVARRGVPASLLLGICPHVGGRLPCQRLARKRRASYPAVLADAPPGVPHPALSPFAFALCTHLFVVERRFAAATPFRNLMLPLGLECRVG